MLNLFRKSNPIDKNKEILSKRLRAVMEVNHRIAGVINSQEVLELATKKLVSLLGVSYAVIWLYDEKQELLRLAYLNLPAAVSKTIEGFVGKSVSDLSYDVNNPEHQANYTVKTFLEGKLSTTTDLFDAGYPLISKSSASILQTLLNIKFVLHVPLISSGIKFGVIGLIWNTEEFTEDDKELVVTFADQISTAIYNSRLFLQSTQQIELLEGKNHELSSLYNLTSQIGQSLDPNVVAQTAVNALPQDESMLGAVLSLYHPDTYLLAPHATSQNALSKQVQAVIGDFNQYAINTHDTDNKDNISLRAFLEKKPIYSNNISDYTSPVVPAKFIDPISKILNIKSLVVYPITMRNDTIGTIAYFLKNKTFEELEENQKQLFQTYTTQIAIALENAELFKTSQQTQASLQKALAELQEARRRERDMIDIMGHELRTPITIARNALLIMQDEQKKQTVAPSPNSAKYLDMSIESVRREITLIETLLSATKIDASRMQLNLTKVDMIDVVNDSIEGQKELANEKKLTVKFNQPSSPIYGYADRTRIQEVVDNFLSNAVKYTPAGEIQISQWIDGTNVWTSVKDQGIGIDAEDLQNLGRKFFRAKQYVGEDAPSHSGQNPDIVRPGGTGLGLYVAFDLIRMLGGKLYINSEVGKGSTFTFSIPTFTNQPDKHFESTFASTQKDDRSHIILNDPKAPRPS